MNHYWGASAMEDHLVKGAWYSKEEKEDSWRQLQSCIGTTQDQVGKWLAGFPDNPEDMYHPETPPRPYRSGDQTPPWLEARACHRANRIARKIESQNQAEREREEYWAAQDEAALRKRKDRSVVPLPKYPQPVPAWRANMHREYQARFNAIPKDGWITIFDGRTEVTSSEAPRETAPERAQRSRRHEYMQRQYQDRFKAAAPDGWSAEFRRRNVDRPTGPNELEEHGW
ncbi:hypothetical protein EDC01DRAFT_725292 [Geopyxis carbonaria]|nr:hypothetical protein EDC01DRAFT_725292 [Geopyxis carbonaria]